MGLFNKKHVEVKSNKTIDISRGELLDATKDKVQSFETSATPKIMEIHSFDDASMPADELLNHKTVIVDLNYCENPEDAKRICDFLNGVIYSIKGDAKKLAKLVYMFTPDAK